MSITRKYSENLDFEGMIISGVLETNLKINPVPSEDVFVEAIDSDLKPYLYRFYIPIDTYEKKLKFLDLINSSVEAKFRLLKTYLLEFFLSSLEEKGASISQEKLIKPL